ncbi:MAG: Membrane dipeptidase (Peptidase family M19) [Deltaproteobacteria bacterium ADurb.Bin207]|jgi:membrane dipeptidase|nr:MAG: Membrane dipeptidase (Peptidase family M19) [Deltaproteobacteria bacterium ADurb.Bin207]
MVCYGWAVDASIVDTHLLDPHSLAGQLGVSLEAVQLAHQVELIDLHVDSFIPYRLYGYDWFERHRSGPLGRLFVGHVDVPRALEGGLSGAMWSITTNPFRTARGRWRTFVRNLHRLRAIFDRSGGKLMLVRSYGEYIAARKKGAIASMIAIQGGHALEAAPNGVASIPDEAVVRVTLVHLTSSAVGVTSVPTSILCRHKGLTDRGRELVRQLDAARCFVDLAHIHPKGFWDAVEEHDRSLPLIVTHTGVSGVKPHWRNLDDTQVRAIADSGGTIGIIFHPGFLRAPGAARDRTVIIDHMQHVIDTVGEDHVSIGSDFDGAIIPSKDLASAGAYPRLVQSMLDRGWETARIEKVLGANFLRVFKMMRP